MYRAMTEMTVSPSLIDRIAACLATFNVPDPRAAAVTNIYRFAATPGWAETWQAAVDTYNVNQNPDTGARTDVISDEMIREGVARFYGPTVRTTADGTVTTKAEDPTLSPEDGGPVFSATPGTDAGGIAPPESHEHVHERGLTTTAPPVDPATHPEAVRHPRG